MPTEKPEGKPDTWNYRVLRHPDDGPDQVLAIHEVHYAEGNKIGWGSVIVVGKDVGELLIVLEQMRRATTEPIIDVRDEPHEP